MNGISIFILLAATHSVTNTNAKRNLNLSIKFDNHTFTQTKEVIKCIMRDWCFFYFDPVLNFSFKFEKTSFPQDMHAFVKFILDLDLYAPSYIFLRQLLYSMYLLFKSFIFHDI